MAVSVFFSHDLYTISITVQYSAFVIAITRRARLAYHL